MKIALAAAVLGPMACGCGPSGNSASVAAEKKEDAEKREQAIKEYYKSRKGPITKRGY